jgi:hypothetical protein
MKRWVVGIVGLLVAAFFAVELWRFDIRSAPGLRLMLAAGIASGLLLAAAPVVLWWQSRSGSGRR